MTIALHQSGIYCIRNTLDDKCYVGQSLNMLKRKKQHFSSLTNGNHHCIFLQRAFDKHGENCFVHDVLEVVTVGITQREQFWMDHFRATSGIYNHAPAGGSPKGIKRSAETKAKISAAKTGRKLSAETKQKMRDAHAGLIESHRIRAKKQWSNPDAIKAKSAQMTGRLTGVDTRLKLSAALKIRWSDIEYKARLSATQKIAQAKLSSMAAHRMKEKWADPEFRESMLLARQEARKQKVVLMQLNAALPLTS